MQDCAVIGVEPKDIRRFQDIHRASGYLCSFPGCRRGFLGFPSASDRNNHESFHSPQFRCAEPDCDFSKIGFNSRQALRKHKLKYHTSVNESPLPRFDSRQPIAKLDSHHASNPERTPFLSPGLFAEASQDNDWITLPRTPTPKTQDTPKPLSIPGTLDTPRTLNAPTTPWPEYFGGEFPMNNQQTAFMDKQHFPSKIYEALSQSPNFTQQIRSWGQLKQWLAQNPLPQLPLDKVLALQTKAFHGFLQASAQNRALNAQPGQPSMVSNALQPGPAPQAQPMNFGIPQGPPGQQANAMPPDMFEPMPPIPEAAITRARMVNTQLRDMPRTQLIAFLTAERERQARKKQMEQQANTMSPDMFEPIPEAAITRARTVNAQLRDMSRTQLIAVLTARRERQMRQKQMMRQEQMVRQKQMEQMEQQANAMSPDMFEPIPEAAITRARMVNAQLRDMPRTQLIAALTAQRERQARGKEMEQQTLQGQNQFGLIPPSSMWTQPHPRSATPTIPGQPASAVRQTWTSP
jgi:hypothetical protein